MGCVRDPFFVVNGEIRQFDVVDDLKWQTGFGRDEQLAELLEVLENSVRRVLIMSEQRRLKISNDD